MYGKYGKIKFIIYNGKKEDTVNLMCFYLQGLQVLEYTVEFWGIENIYPLPL
jgi:hypothetical protein